MERATFWPLSFLSSRCFALWPLLALPYCAKASLKIISTLLKKARPGPSDRYAPKEISSQLDRELISQAVSALAALVALCGNFNLVFRHASTQFPCRRL